VKSLAKRKQLILLLMGERGWDLVASQESCLLLSRGAARLNHPFPGIVGHIIEGWEVEVANEPRGAGIVPKTRIEWHRVRSRNHSVIGVPVTLRDNIRAIR